MNKKGLLVVVSGPSGTGKGTVLNEFFKTQENVHLSISATTRGPRPGEVDGVSYFFMSKEAFLELKAQNGFLENAEFCGNFYGTPREKVLEKLDSGMDVILEIEVQGAMQVKASYPAAVLIFVVPPSFEELRNRLYGRQTESEEVIEKRLCTAKEELKLIDKYDYILLNDTPQNAAKRLSVIIEAEKNRTDRNIDFIKERLL